jgi:hypothetical protein
MNEFIDPALDPEEPGLDEEMRQLRRSLAKLHAMSAEEIFQILVRFGIYTPDGELTERYRSDDPPRPL